MEFLEVKRGDLVLVDFREAIGSEQKGVRPSVVVQNDTGNLFSGCTIVVPITSSKMENKQPTHAVIDTGYKFKKSTALCEQVATVDKSRVLKVLYHLNYKEMQKIDKSLKVSLSL